MRAALFVLAVTAAPALADPEPLRMAPADPSPGPVVAPGATVSACDDGTEGRILSARRVVGTTTAFVLHDCGMDAMTQLAFHTSRGWFTSSSTTIAYYAANMTEFPLRITLVAERLGTGALADGTRAIVQTVETEQRDENLARVLVVQVCSVDDDPACAFLRYRCPVKACPAKVQLSRGTLIIGTDRRKVLR